MNGNGTKVVQIVMIFILMLQMAAPALAGTRASTMDYADCQNFNENEELYMWQNLTFETPFIEVNYTLIWKWAADAGDSPESKFLLVDPKGTVLYDPGYVKHHEGELVVKVPGKYKFSWFNDNIYNEVHIIYFIDICHTVRSIFSFPDSQLWTMIGLVAIVVVVVIIYIWVRRIRRKYKEQMMSKS